MRPLKSLAHSSQGFMGKSSYRLGVMLRCGKLPYTGTQSFGRPKKPWSDKIVVIALPLLRLFLKLPFQKVSPKSALLPSGRELIQSGDERPRCGLYLLRRNPIFRN